MAEQLLRLRLHCFVSKRNACPFALSFASRFQMFARALKSAIPASVRSFSSAKAPLRVVITGPAGAIGYAMLFRIASGEMLGKDQPIELRLLELPVSFPAHFVADRHN